eukprot:TRINITY_DN13509_c0_g2_i6.p1 TRINITY_DN13509_c0_g2~~TRINITY_DN13509_c0_g2_i6.p1  ORF type:complete len:124 (-),score=18.84 TRINITY_DN13509_c0_g2_i6:170-541(-)
MMMILLLCDSDSHHSDDEWGWDRTRDINMRIDTLLPTTELTNGGTRDGICHTFFTLFDLFAFIDRPCQERSTGQQFALKCLLDCSRSRQETRIHQLVSGHPHIVSLYCVYHNTIRLEGDGTPR